MIAIAGGSGRLGTALVARLLARGEAVRLLTRDIERARRRLDALTPPVATAALEFVQVDVREPATLGGALVGVDVVVSSIQGFGGEDAGGMQAVDADGNRRLVDAAARARVRRFVLMSMQGASPDAPLALGRAKAEAEAAVRASGLDWAIVRPSTYLETWVSLLGDPIISTGRARVFGRGQNPINFVSALDVAAIVDGVVRDDRPARVVEVRGPADLTFDAIVEHFSRALGHPVPIARVPRPALWILSTVLRPVRPILAAQVGAALDMDRADLGGSLSAGADGAIGRTTVDDAIRTYLAAATGRSAVQPST